MSAEADRTAETEASIIRLRVSIRDALNDARMTASAVGRTEPHGRNVAMVITHLEDALLRLQAPSVL